VDLALGGGLKGAGEIVTQARHHRHLLNCLDYLRQARELLGQATPWELVALELMEAVRELGEITGQEVGDEVLDRIFSEFCLGNNQAVWGEVGAPPLQSHLNAVRPSHQDFIGRKPVLCNGSNQD
jgi:hypothetical protein